MGEVPGSEAGAAGVWPAGPRMRSPRVRLSWLVSPEHKEGLRTPMRARALSLLGPVGVPGNPVAPSMPMAWETLSLGRGTCVLLTAAFCPIPMQIASHAGRQPRLLRAAPLERE